MTIVEALVERPLRGWWLRSLPTPHLPTVKGRRAPPAPARGKGFGESDV